MAKQRRIRNSFSIQALGALSILSGLGLSSACSSDDGQDADGAGGGGGEAPSDDGGSSGGKGSGGNGPSGGSAMGGGGGSGEGGEGPMDPEVLELLPSKTLLLENAINPYALEFATGGKLWIAGTTDISSVTTAQSSGNLRLAVWRLDESGALDTSFSEDGKATSDFVNPGTAYSVKQLSDGSLVILAAGEKGVHLVKMSAAGEFDTEVKLEFGWSEASREELNDVCSDAAAQDECEDAQTSLVGGVCETSGVNYDLDACTSQRADCLATELAQDCVSAWPAATVPLFSERPAQYASWGMELDTSSSQERLVVFAHGPAVMVESGTQRTDNDRFVARYFADDFDLDSSFATNGWFSYDAQGLALGDNSRRGFVRGDGSIVTSGYTKMVEGATDKGNHLILIALDESGELEANFGFSDDETYPGQPGIAYYNPFRSQVFPGTTPSAGFAEAYAAVELSDGKIVTTGYGNTNFATPTVLVDIVATQYDPSAPDGLVLSYGGNDASQYLGSFVVQSELDPLAATYQDRGRDLIALSDDRTVHVGLYDGVAAMIVLDESGHPDPRVGSGTGRIQYNYPQNFFVVEQNAARDRFAAASASQAKVTTGAGSYAKSLLAIVDVLQP